MKRPPPRRGPARAAALLFLLTGCDRQAAPPAPSRARAVTFNEDVAPLVRAHCAPCHRPGEAGPFSLLGYADVRKRAEQIARVTSIRYMPPWPPEPGYGEFAGQRRLTDEQVALIQRWVRDGAAEGPPGRPPPPLPPNEGWQLGRPDLVIEMVDSYAVPADGTDVFRNFVLPVPGRETRFVRALELRPGDKRVVHHANVLPDRTGSSRGQDARDPGPGFGGMDVELESDAFAPDSHFLFWKPGTAAVSEPEDMAWALDGNMDLVLNMHLQPTGKPETIRPVIGLYFTERAPSRFPMLLQLEHDGALDIPPGAKEFVITDNYALPVDVEVLGIYPHAHYLGRDVQAWATLPDGRRAWLIWIRDWDLAWQAVYRYARPVVLPRGSTLHMRIAYDNSAENVRNPSQPPRRVRAGNRSSDEMGHVWVQVLPRRRDDRQVLQETFMRRRLEKYPGDFLAHANLAVMLEARGAREEALEQYGYALRARPGSAVVLNNVGALQQALGRPDEALRAYREAVRADPGYLNARYNLGNALSARNEFAAAAPHFREVVRLRPHDATARNNLGAALLATGRSAEAVAELQRALEADPASLNIHYNLARALAARGRLKEALSHLEQALRIAPDDANARQDLTWLKARLASRNEQE